MTAISAGYRGQGHPVLFSIYGHEKRDLRMVFFIDELNYKSKCSMKK